MTARSKQNDPRTTMRGTAIATDELAVTRGCHVTATIDTRLPTTKTARYRSVMYAQPNILMTFLNLHHTEV